MPYFSILQKESKQPLHVRRGFTLAGFTLIEILVVLLIISIIATAAAFVVGRSLALQDLRNSAQKLAVIIPLAQQQALLSGEPVGLLLSSQGYQFFEFSDNGWQPLSQEVFSYHPFPSQLTVKLLIQGKAVDLSAVDLSTETADVPVPQITFSTTGDITPFAIILDTSSKLEALQITKGANGNIAVVPYLEKKSASQ